MVEALCIAQVTRIRLRLDYSHASYARDPEALCITQVTRIRLRLDYSHASRARDPQKLLVYLFWITWR